jgi:AI-2 transport protein TqsA
MPKKDTRREIEELRALVDAMQDTQRIPAVPVPDSRPPESGPSQKAAASTLGASAGVNLESALQPTGFSSAGLAQSTFLIAVALAFLVAGRSFLVPLAVALLVWNLLNALAGAFERIRFLGRPFPKWLAWPMSLIALLLTNALFYWILVSQSDALRKAAPVYQANLEKLTGKLTALLGIEKMPSTAQLVESLDLGAMLSWLGGSVGATLSEIVLVALYVAFLMVEQKFFPVKITRLASSEQDAARMRALMTDISKQIQTYICIKTVVSLLTGLVSYIVLRLIGVDFAAVWALIIFLLNYIPNVGSFLGVVFPALLTLVQFETFTPFVMVAVGLGAVQFIIGNVVEPSMMGSSLNLSSFVIILSLTFWGMVWGIAGMILCVPIMVCIAIVCAHFHQLHWVAVLLSTDGNVKTFP